MRHRSLSTVIRGLVDAVFRPRRFVAAQMSAYSTSRMSKLRQIGRLFGVYLVNLITFAGPLTVAGIGVPNTAGSPPSIIHLISPIFGDTATVWRLLLGFIQNSSFITVLAGITLITYHAGILLTRNSAGIIQSIHTVVYSTSAYLAGIFTAVWYLSTTSGLDTAKQYVLNLQREGIYIIIDLLGSGLELPGGRPEQLFIGDFSLTGTLLLSLLVVLLLYYVYSLYLGARLNHRMNRLASVVAVIAVALAPVLYVAGSILVSATQLSGGI